MYCYNLEVNNITKDHGTFYVWDETQAKRVSQEIAACLIKHFKILPETVRHEIIYSDTCTGQNRNIKIALSLLKFVSSETNIETIDHKFLVSEHSYLPNDSDFGSVESAMANRDIYLPQDWYNIMATCRRQKKFIIVKMDRTEFLSAKQLEENIVRRKKNTHNDSINWLNIQWLRYKKDLPWTTLYKENLKRKKRTPTVIFEECRPRSIIPTAITSK